MKLEKEVEDKETILAGINAKLSDQPSQIERLTETLQVLERERHLTENRLEFLKVCSFELHSGQPKLRSTQRRGTTHHRRKEL